MDLIIKDLCGKKTVTRSEGRMLNDLITKKWDSEQSFYIDFDNVLVASVSFMDEAFGKLALLYSRETLQKKLKFKNILDYDRALLNDILNSRFRQKNVENGE